MYDAFVRLIDKPFVGLESFKPRGAVFLNQVPYLEVFICEVGGFEFFSNSLVNDQK